MLLLSSMRLWGMAIFWHIWNERWSILRLSCPLVSTNEHRIRKTFYLYCRSPNTPYEYLKNAYPFIYIVLNGLNKVCSVKECGVCETGMQIVLDTWVDGADNLLLFLHALWKTKKFGKYFKVHLHPNILIPCILGNCIHIFTRDPLRRTGSSRAGRKRNR